MTQTLLENWKNRKPNTQKENLKLIKLLSLRKNKHTIDEQAQQLHQQAFEKINCLQCANCCQSIPPIVTPSDTTRIARHLGIKPTKFETQYLTTDTDGDTVMKTTPCVFLEPNTNQCQIYDVRPKACRQFPHTDTYDFAKNLQLHTQNANICPAVFHILECFKTIKTP